MTNYEKIKAMSVEELAYHFSSNSLCEHIRDENYEFCVAHDDCDKCIEKWLLQEAEE
jgi:hypothetical protein